jgi:hypothetical protein
LVPVNVQHAAKAVVLELVDPVRMTVSTKEFNKRVMASVSSSDD